MWVLLQRTTWLKIPKNLRALIYHLEIPRNPSSLDPDNTVFALQLAPWQGIFTLLNCYVHLQHVVNFLSTYMNYTRTHLYLTTTPQVGPSLNWFARPQPLYIFTHSTHDQE